MTKKKDSPCMFCDQLPCQCNGPVRSPKKRAQKKLEAVAPPVVTEPSDPIDFNDLRPVPEPRFRLINTTRDWVFESALFTLINSGILSPEDQEEAEKLASRPRSSQLEKRLIDWRERHGNNL